MLTILYLIHFIFSYILLHFCLFITVCLPIALYYITALYFYLYFLYYSLTFIFYVYIHLKLFILFIIILFIFIIHFCILLFSSLPYLRSTFPFTLICNSSLFCTFRTFILHFYTSIRFFERNLSLIIFTTMYFKMIILITLFEFTGLNCWLQFANYTSFSTRTLC